MFFKNIQKKKLKLIAEVITKIFIREKNNLIIFLHGDIGTGKTTFSRYCINFLGISDTIKSPTYSIIETYYAKNFDIIHADFYRLNNINEYYDLDIFNFINKRYFFIIEWPNNIKNIRNVIKNDIEFSFYYKKKNIRNIDIISNSLLIRNIKNVIE